MQGRELRTKPHFANVSSRRGTWPRSVAFEMALEQRAIGRRIAELREDRRLTQPVVADRVGVSLRAYQKWEAGTSAPAWRNLEHLAEVFSVTADYLLGAAQDKRQDAVEQLDRIESELGAIRVELGQMATQLEDLTRSLARKPGTGASKTRSRKAK